MSRHNAAAAGWLVVALVCVLKAIDTARDALRYDVNVALGIALSVAFVGLAGWAVFIWYRVRPRNGRYSPP